ncbi:MAG: amidohydrolase family protein [Halanaerobiales bacterium]
MNLVLYANKIFDGENKELIEDGVIVVEDKKIQKIGKKKNLKLPLNAKEIDLSNYTLMPGLIDGHTHLCLSADIKDFLIKNNSKNKIFKRALDNIKKDISNGITTIRCPGEVSYIDVIFKKIIKYNIKMGPRIFSAGKGIRSSEGHGFIGHPVDDINQIDNIFDENIRNGADFFKFYITGLLPNNNKIPYYYNKNMIKKIIDLAHKTKMEISAHAVGGEGLIFALKSGIDTIEHGYLIDKKAIELFVENQTRLVMTNTFMFNDQVNKNLHDKNVAEEIKSYRYDMKKTFADIFDSNMDLSLGTDALHGQLWREIKVATELGLSNFRALNIATYENAKLLNMEKDIGSLKPDKKADIIGINGNPLNKINDLSKVDFVMKDGLIIKGKE